jgi:hypothetical protein
MNDFHGSVISKSNEELLKMVYEFDLWSPEMLTAVEQELAQRNILPNDISSRKQQLAEAENAQLAAGKEASPFGQIFGWLTVFGPVGLAIGYNYAFSKAKCKYSNKTYFKYNEEARKRGRFLMIASIFVMVVLILARIFWGDVDE